MSNFYLLRDKSQQHENTVQNPMTRHLDAGKFKIINHKTYPDANTDLCTKKYVDTQIEQKAATRLALIGRNAMAASLNMGSQKITHLATPTDDTDATTKKYVDDSDKLLLPLDGSRSMTSHLNMGIRKITFLNDTPTHDLDAVPKTYVDRLVTNAVGNVQQAFQYGFSFTELSLNTREYPFYFYKGSPAPYMFLKGLRSTSYFHLQSHHFDSDSTIPSNLTIQYRLTILNRMEI